MNRTKKIIFIAILVATSVILSIVDRFITAAAFPMLPQAKIGLANIIVLFTLMNFSFKETFVLVVLKSIIANLIFGQITSFIIGGGASLASFFVMYLLWHYLHKFLSPMGVSVAGGFIHIITQLLIIIILYFPSNYETIIIYGVFLTLMSLVTSFLIGLLIYKANPRFQEIMKTLA